MLIPAILITTLVGVTIAIIVGYALPGLHERCVVLACEPDAPKPFGADMAWIAVRSEDAGRIVRILELSDPQAANWDAGIGAIYDAAFSDTHVFVSPPVKGWTFVAGVPLPIPAGRSFIDKLTPLLVRLGAEFREVQYFASYPAIDFYAWARLEKGSCVRLRWAKRVWCGTAAG